MSENEPLEKLAQDMLASTDSLRKLVVNQQETLAGISALLQVHTQGLRMNQKIIEALAVESGIAFTPDDPTAPSDPMH